MSIVVNKTYHIAVPIKRLHPRQELFVVSQRNEDLSVITDRLLQNRQGPLADLVLLELPQLRLIELRSRGVGELTTWKLKI